MPEVPRSLSVLYPSPKKDPLSNAYLTGPMSVAVHSAVESATKVVSKKEDETTMIKEEVALTLQTTFAQELKILNEME